MSHECYVPDCPETISDAYLLCPFHWHRVSTNTKNLVNSTWRAVNNSRLAGGLGARFAAYKEAKNRAIAEAIASDPPPAFQEAEKDSFRKIAPGVQTAPQLPNL